MKQYIIEHLPCYVCLAGIGQIVLATGSLALPRLLNWKENLAPMKKLVRVHFITLLGYILCLNFFFGIVSVVLPEDLCDGSSLAVAFSLLLSLYWVARVFIQFAFNKVPEKPKGVFFTIAEILLWGLFIFLAIVYSLVFLHNVNIL